MHSYSTTRRPRSQPQAGSIRQHVARDGTITWRVRIDIRTENNHRYQPQRTFASRPEAEAGLKEWLAELCLDPDPEPTPRSRTPARTDVVGVRAVAAIPSIYFVYAQTMAAIKIGHSGYVPHRVQALQLATADTLRLVALQAGDRRDECALHRRFDRLRIRGEWYADKPPLRAYITRYALSPWDYYDAQCPDWATRVLRAYPDVFGPDEWAWCKPMF